jgi:hypothetical protein
MHTSVAHSAGNQWMIVQLFHIYERGLNETAVLVCPSLPSRLVTSPHMPVFALWYCTAASALHLLPCASVTLHAQIAVGSARMLCAG